MIIDITNWQPKKAQGFIVLEGSNGAGKTTQQQNIKNFFEQQGFSCLNTREPGSGALGAEIRKLTLSSTIVINPLSELLLFEADRAEHVSTIIKPALNNKQIVISDRYYYSSEAFQGYGRGLDLELIQNLNEIAIQKLRPDLVILLDLEPQTGLERIDNRKANSSELERDRFEEAQLDFHRRVREGFLTIAQQAPEAFLIIDASKNISAVWLEIEVALNRLLPCLKK